MDGVNEAHDNAYVHEKKTKAEELRVPAMIEGQNARTVSD